MSHILSVEIFLEQNIFGYFPPILKWLREDLIFELKYFSNWQCYHYLHWNPKPRPITQISPI